MKPQPRADLEHQLEECRRELAEARKQLTEALERQTATSEVLQVISSSPGGLAPVFEAMLERATCICEAKFGNLFLREGNAFRAVALHGEHPYVDSWRREPLVHMNAETAGIPLQRLFNTKEIIHIADLANERTYLERRPRIVRLVEDAGARTLLLVPMLKDRELVGTIGIYRTEVRPFSDKQIDLLQNFAAQAVIAIENARLLNELRESLQQQTATSEVLQVISSSPGALEPVFQAMLENAARICEAKFGNVFRLENGAMRPVASLGMPEPLTEFFQHGPHQPHVDAPIMRSPERNSLRMSSISPRNVHTSSAMRWRSRRSNLAASGRSSLSRCSRRAS